MDCHCLQNMASMQTEKPHQVYHERIKQSGKEITVIRNILECCIKNMVKPLITSIDSGNSANKQIQPSRTGCNNTEWNQRTDCRDTASPHPRGILFQHQFMASAQL